MSAQTNPGSHKPPSGEKIPEKPTAAGPVRKRPIIIHEDDGRRR